jgi:2,4-dienoyl-CoA reductase (NADPH2)
LGKEREYAVKPADQKKRVLVVGGGPGGMEAARVAALRGHEVTLYEKDRKLGGLLVLASLVKGLEVENLLELIRYFRIQIEKLGIKVKLGQEVNLNLIEEIKPDVIILATGGQFDTSQKAVSNSTKVVTTASLSVKAKALSLLLGPKLLGWLTKFWLPLGKNVVIMGGQMKGCQMARFLVNRGRKVTILESAEQIGTGVPYIIKPKLLAWLAENGVTILSGVKYGEITDEGIFVTTKDGKRELIVADTILNVAPPTQGNEFFEALKKRIPGVYMIGDGMESASIIEAIAEGSRIGHAI